MARILVVEDNPANLKLATFLLESAGHTVLKATDAEAGLALARDSQPSLILMDIQLPGMDGLQATALLKGDEATRAIPVGDISDRRRTASGRTWTSTPDASRSPRSGPSSASTTIGSKRSRSRPAVRRCS